MSNNLNFSNCGNRKQVKQVVENYLQYKDTCKTSKVGQWFKERGLEGRIQSDDIFNDIVYVWNWRIAEEQAFHVTIKSHYVDAGSVDYVYTYEISKMK